MSLTIRTAVRGAIREFIEVTTAYKVCDAVHNDASAINKARENHCDLILLHLTTPLQDSLVTVSVLRSKLRHVKIVAFSTLSVDLGNLVSPTIGYDAVLTRSERQWITYARPLGWFSSGRSANCKSTIRRTMLTAQRIRRATQLNKAIATDLAPHELTSETAVLEEQ